MARTSAGSDARKGKKARRNGKRANAQAGQAGKPKRMTAQAYAVLENQIVTGVLKPGAFLSEPALTRDTGLGRTPVREALRQLESRHLVVIVPHRGAFVSPIDPASQLQIIAMRRELDSALVKAAVQRASAAQRARMLALSTDIVRAAKSADRHSLAATDAESKEILLQAADNPFLRMALEPLYLLSRRYFFMSPEFDPAIPGLEAELMQAIAGEDVEGAEAAGMRILDRLERKIMRSLSEGISLSA